MSLIRSVRTVQINKIEKYVVINKLVDTYTSLYKKVCTLGSYTSRSLVDNSIDAVVFFLARGFFENNHCSLISLEFIYSICMNNSTGKTEIIFLFYFPR